MGTCVSSISTFKFTISVNCLTYRIGKLLKITRADIWNFSVLFDLLWGLIYKKSSQWKYRSLVQSHDQKTDNARVDVRQFMRKSSHGRNYSINMGSLEEYSKIQKTVMLSLVNLLLLATGILFHPYYRNLIPNWYTVFGKPMRGIVLESCLEKKTRFLTPYNHYVMIIMNF